MIETISGLMTLSEKLLCKREVLGKSFETTISGIKANVFFPVCPPVNTDDFASFKVGMNNPLQAPKGGGTWKCDDWGYIVQMPTCSCVVNHLTLSVACEEEQVMSVAETLYKSIEKWEKAFQDYIRIATKQNTQRKTDYLKKTCSLELKTKEHIRGTGSACLHITVTPLDYYAASKQIENAARFAGSEKELFSDYQMLLAAYDARRIDQNRHAIVNATSALEKCIVTFLENELAGQYSDVGAFLEKKHRKLGERIQLAKDLDTTFPDIDFQTKVLGPRNDLAHNREFYPTNDTTEEHIKCVEICLEHFHAGKFYEGE